MRSFLLIAAALLAFGATMTASSTVARAASALRIASIAPARTERGTAIAAP